MQSCVCLHHIYHQSRFKGVIFQRARVFMFVFSHAWLAVCLSYRSRSPCCVVCICMCMRSPACALAAWCLNIETFIVMLSDLSGRVEMDIGLYDSQRSDCHTSPKTSLLHHAAGDGSFKRDWEGRRKWWRGKREVQRAKSRQGRTIRT